MRRPSCVGRGNSSHPGCSLPAAARAPATAGPQPAAPCRSGRAARSCSLCVPAPQPAAARAAALASVRPPAARAATAARWHARARQGCRTRPAAPGPTRIWKTAAQMLRPIRPPVRPASVRPSSVQPPASASLGQSADMPWPVLSTQAWTALSSGAAERSRPSSLGTPRHSNRGTADHGVAGRDSAALGWVWGGVVHLGCRWAKP